MLVFRLMQNHLSLAEKEVLALSGKNVAQRYGELLVLDTEVEMSNRLGLCHSIWTLIDIFEEHELKSQTEKMDWNRVCHGKICIRTYPGDHEKEVSGAVLASLPYAKVDLTKPDTKIGFFFRAGKVIICRHIADVDKGYLKRKAHMRPQMHPTSMHPGLARACINLTGLSHGRILDPFCGSGGFLLEAGLMGFDVVGYDIDENQLARAKKNLEYYGVKYELQKIDSSKLQGRYDAIVTDLPYGRSSKVENIRHLYSAFLSTALACTTNMVVVMPDASWTEDLVRSSDWSIVSAEKVYVHRSLSRSIYSLIPKNHCPS
jgi:tRNA (guanine10-N2)-dimethyltransferase